MNMTECQLAYACQLADVRALARCPRLQPGLLSQQTSAEKGEFPNRQKFHFERMPFTSAICRCGLTYLSWTLSNLSKTDPGRDPAVGRRGIASDS